MSVQRTQVGGGSAHHVHGGCPGRAAVNGRRRHEEQVAEIVGGNPADHVSRRNRGQRSSAPSPPAGCSRRADRARSVRRWRRAEPREGMVASPVTTSAKGRAGARPAAGRCRCRRAEGRTVAEPYAGESRGRRWRRRRGRAVPGPGRQERGASCAGLQARKFALDQGGHPLRRGRAHQRGMLWVPRHSGAGRRIRRRPARQRRPHGVGLGGGEDLGPERHGSRGPGYRCEPGAWWGRGVQATRFRASCSSRTGVRPAP